MDQNNLGECNTKKNYEFEIQIGNYFIHNNLI